MVRGLGIDLIATRRMSRALERYGERFERRVFTDREIEQCEHRTDRVLALAARFAAKEACLKALGTGWARGLTFRDVEVVREESGRPQMLLHGSAAERARQIGVSSVHVSLTHERETAAAVVVLEG